MSSYKLEALKCDCCNNSEACLTSVHSACLRNFFGFFFDFILVFQSLIGVMFTTVFVVANYFTRLILTYASDLVSTLPRAYELNQPLHD